MSGRPFFVIVDDSLAIRKAVLQMVSEQMGDGRIPEVEIVEAATSTEAITLISDLFDRGERIGCLIDQSLGPNGGVGDDVAKICEAQGTRYCRFTMNPESIVCYKGLGVYDKASDLNVSEILSRLFSE